MKRLLVLPAVILAVAASALADNISTDGWPLPTPPPGANPATFPVPREDWIARVQGFLDADKGKHFDLIFDGDSITDFWQRAGKAVWTERYGALNAVDFGISADKVEHLLWRLQHGQVDGLDPKLVVMMIGTNNTARDSVDQIAEGVSVVTAEYEKRCPNAHILLLAIFPRANLATDPLRAKIAAINTKLAALQSDRVTFLDIGSKFLTPDGTLTKEIMPDFLHPSEKGYEIWADAIQPIVDKYVPAPAQAAASPSPSGSP
jgi:lysophospholipase L1-like esterase